MTLAPAANAALASRAICSGVTGTWCCLGSVSTPFSAQVMTALSPMDEAPPGCSVAERSAEYGNGGRCHQHRHCERSEAIQRNKARLDCFVAALLAMTIIFASAPSAARRQDFPRPPRA